MSYSPRPCIQQGLHVLIALGHVGFSVQRDENNYLMRDLLQAVQGSYVVQSVYGGRQASVEAEYLIGENRQEHRISCLIC